ncbi:hypothetical protein ACFE04_020522 [Oxalis oulophora]
MSFPLIESIYVNDDSLREWKNGNPNFRLSTPVNMPRFLFELCSSMVRGELPIQKCKLATESVTFSERVSTEELASNFADIVTQMALDVRVNSSFFEYTLDVNFISLTMPGEYRSRLAKLAKWLVDSTLVPLRFFHERSEEEFLWEAEMIKIKGQELKNKEVRVNTRLLYQQTKFNLLREESEGYAKLVTLLCRGSEDPNLNASAANIGVIKSLIGHFDLDPNRVFDIVLECFELQPDNNSFLELIPIFPKSHASQILGFKFQYYQRMEVNSPIPFGLYKLTALLVKEEFIDLYSIYSHLLPTDEEAFEHYNVFQAKRLDEANKIGKINLAATGKDLMDDEKPGDVTVDLFAALDMENKAVLERATELENNQTLGLLLGFLSVDDWHHAHKLFQRLAPLNPVAHIQICDGLFRQAQLIRKSISSAYALVHESHLQNLESSAGASVEPMETENSSLSRTSIDLPKEVFQMLAIAGPYLHRDIVLLQKVCKVLRGYYSSALENLKHVTNESRDPRLHLKETSIVEEALGACLLPSLQLIPANPAVGHEIWEVLNLLPYETRYRLYAEWEKDDERHPMILAARQIAKLDTRRILKRLAKDNLKQLGRMVAKLAHANPMTVLRTIVNQIEAYRDMIAPVVDAFKYLTQLEYDALEYVVIERLAQVGRDKLKDDGINLSDWLQSLASFWGHLCKKYPSMELRGLFQYLVNQLKKGQGIEIVLLQELVQHMANVQFTENLTEEDLEAMGGSDTLRYLATSAFAVARNNKALIKSTNRLKDSLLPKDEPKLAATLLLLIAQHRSVVVINSDSPYIKMVCEQFDRCHGTLLQYVEFLSTAVTPTSYAQLIPSLNDLIHLYHIDPEAAFLIYRPVMRVFKSRGSQNDNFWPLDSNHSISESEPTEGNVDLILDLDPSEKSILWSDLLDTVRTVLPSKAWNSLSPDLYATFWGLTLYDLYVPRSRYESEIAKQHAALKDLEEQIDNSNSAISRRKKEKERVQEFLDRLINDLKRHEDNVASVRRRLSREKDKWLSSCPDTLKINMEFLQRCVFPRCTFSMPDAVYCAMFVHTLHSLGTPFFNTVNHIDVLICKTLQPMICCSTEYEAGRLGRFLHETLKMAYYWRRDETIYERECGNMPGFAVYYRYPNSQRVTYGQFIKVHWKWSQKLTKLFIQCLESTEYMEIRNALIMLTKISGVFPVTRKSGINLEKRVAKIRSDEREDLKVLAISVAAALSARKPAWVTEEEFGMGYVDLKPVLKTPGSSSGAVNGSAVHRSQAELSGGKSMAKVSQNSDSRAKASDGRLERTESSPVKSDQGHAKSKGNDSDIHSSFVQGGASRSIQDKKQVDQYTGKSSEENLAKAALKSSESEIKASGKRSASAGSLTKTLKQDLVKDDGKSGKSIGREVSSHTSEGRQGGAINISSLAIPNGNSSVNSAKGSSTRVPDNIHGIESKLETGIVKSDNSEVVDAPRPSSSRLIHSPRHENPTGTKIGDKILKRGNLAEEPDRLGKRRKGEDLEFETRLPDREKSADLRSSDVGNDDQSSYRAERSKDNKVNERFDKDYRDRVERPEKSRGSDDLVSERSRDRASMERYAREHSVERGQERGVNRKDDRSKVRSGDPSIEKSHIDERFHGQGGGLPPPPPLPLHMVPHSLRRDEDADRRYGNSSRHAQRLSPRHDDKERRRSEENAPVSQDDAKRRKEDDFRDRKRDDREGFSIKVEEREREREREKEKVNLLKEDADLAAASKRRKLKRDHMGAVEAGEYSPVGHPPPPLISMSQSYDGRDSRGGDRKGAMIGYLEEPPMRIHGKEVAVGKMTRRDIDPYP